MSLRNESQEVDIPIGEGGFSLLGRGRPHFPKTHDESAFLGFTITRIVSVVKAYGRNGQCDVCNNRKTRFNAPF